jgi:Spy/CpxP family protein refolding chaperone
VEATPAQREKVLAVTAGVQERFRADRAAKQKTRQALLAEWSAPAPNGDTVRLTVDEATSRMLANAHALVDAGVQIHQVLTPEQRKELVDDMPIGRARFAFGMARRMGYGPPANKADLKERADERFAEWMDELEATGDQRAKLSPLLDDVLASTEPLLGTPETLKDAVTAAWTSDTPNAAALHELVDLEGEKLTVLAQTASQSLVKAHAVLTPDQRKQVAARMTSSGGCDHDDADADVAEAK